MLTLDPDEGGGARLYIDDPPHVGARGAAPLRGVARPPSIMEPSNVLSSLSVDNDIDVCSSARHLSQTYGTGATCTPGRI